MKVDVVSRARIARIVTVAACGIASMALPAVAQATAPGANGRIAFVSDRNGTGGYDLFSVNPDGTGVQPVSVNAGQSDWEPGYSPDGKKIAFVSGSSNSDIFVANANGSNPVDITNTPSADEENPSFSPDGTQIAFRRSNHIWVMDAGGGTPAMLPSSSTNDDEPTWSPDGTKVIFTEVVNGQNEIVETKADGSQATPTNLTQNDALDGNPTVAPDGRIAFIRALDSSPNWDIFVMNADGSGQTDITNAAGIESNPSWSPDGTRIAYTKGFGGAADIWTMRPDGTGQKRVTTNTNIDDSSPDWQPLPTLAGVTSGKLTVSARPGRTNNLRVYQPSGSAHFRVSDQPDHGAGIEGAPVFPQAGCSRITIYVVDCGTGVTSIVEAGNDGADTLNNSTVTPATLNGGAQDDTLLGAGGADTLLGGDGSDVFHAAGGTDSIFSQDNAADGTIDCGAGRRDTANTDADKDPAPVGCETVTH